MIRSTAVFDALPIVLNVKAPSQDKVIAWRMSDTDVQLVAAGYPWKEESVLYSASEQLNMSLNKGNESRHYCRVCAGWRSNDEQRLLAAGEAAQPALHGQFVRHERRPSASVFRHEYT